MINKDNVFDGAGGAMCLWCGAGADGADLAAAAECIASVGGAMISVAAPSVGVLWPWLEKTNVKIMARFYLESADDAALADFTRRAAAAFKQGASGAQVFLRVRDLAAFADALHLIRDDLFFNKDLSVGLDIGEIDAALWGAVFDALEKLRADSVLLALTVDRGNKSDFVGRVYGMLDTWRDTWGGAVHWALGNNFTRIDQARRLGERMRPALAARAMFFLNA